MTKNALFHHAVCLALALCAGVFPELASADESGAASLSIRNVTLQPFDINSNATVALPAPERQGQRLALFAYGGPAPKEVRWESNGAPVATSASISLTADEGTSIYVYDRFEADLEGHISSISAPYVETDAYYSSFVHFTLAPFTALTISGQISGEVMRSRSNSLPTTTVSLVTFDVAFFGYPASEIPEWGFARSTSNGELAFDEPFSLTAYNRTADPLLVSLEVYARADATAVLSAIPEPHMGYMLATGVALLLLRRKRSEDKKITNDET